MGFLAASLLSVKSHHVIVRLPHSFQARDTPREGTESAISETPLGLRLHVTLLGVGKCPGAWADGRG